MECANETPFECCQSLVGISKKRSDWRFSKLELKIDGLSKNFDAPEIKMKNNILQLASQKIGSSQLQTLIKKHY